MASYEQETETLFDIFGQYDCERREQIAHLTGWSIPKVDSVLHVIRRDHTLGFTVPYVGSGTGYHVYRMVLADGSGQTLDEDEMKALLKAAAGILGSARSLNRNEAHQLRVAAQYMPTTEATHVLRYVAMAEGAAAMSPANEVRALADGLSP